jgi:succinoglycan biosynthesis transport protein ExoP
VPNLDQLVATYVGLVDTDPVRRRLANSGVPRQPGELKGHILAVRAPNTTLINVTVTDRDPAVALLIAQNVIPAVNQSLQELQAQVPGSNQNSHLDALIPWEVPTDRPGSPISPNVPRNGLLAVAAGLALAIGLAFVLERLDQTIKTEADVRLKLGVPLLGSVFYRPLERAEASLGEELEIITATHQMDRVSEQYRAIRTSILFSRIDERLATIVVTSTLPGEGKTTTACNLAVVMAQAGNRVILVDADFRRPGLQQVFDIQPNVGLSDAVIGNGSIEELLVDTTVENLRVLTSGPTPPNPSEVLGSTAMDRVIEQLTSSTDVIILDTPPLAAVTDATVLGALVDGLVLVVEEGRTPITSVKRSIETLAAVGVEPLGVVLNKSSSAETEFYPYGSENVKRGWRRRPSRKGSESASGAPGVPRPETPA